MTTYEINHAIPSTEPLAVPRRSFATIQLPTGVRLHYAEQGDPAGPALILLHGVTDSWFSWSDILPRLSTAYHVFALDQRGHGDSDRPEQGYGVSGFAADVLAFMDVAGVSTATVVGHSMGSFIAQRVAGIAPRRIDGLVLVGASATPRFTAIDELKATADELADPVPEDFVREFQASTIHRPIPEAFFERVVAESLKLPARVWQATVAGWLSAERWAEPQRLTMPVLILWGDRDQVMPYEEQKRLVAALPHAVFTVYPETGHALHWEQPERFAHDLTAFLSEA